VLPQLFPFFSTTILWWNKDDGIDYIWAAFIHH